MGSRAGAVRRSVVAVVGAVVVGCVATACASADDATPETRTFRYDGPTLDVRAESATDLVAADREDIKVTRWFDEGFAATGAKKSWRLTRKGTLHLRAGCNGFANCEARYRVEVPKDLRVLRDGKATKLTGRGTGRTG